MTTSTYDPILAQVIARRLEVVCDEAAITLNHSSGSPIVTEANDFSTSLVSVDGDVIAFSSYLPPHFVSAMNAVRNIIETLDLSTVKPGDHFAANDPYTVHPLHAADPSIITPVFAGEELVAWAYSSVHVLDLGGLPSEQPDVAGLLPTLGSAAVGPETADVLGNRVLGRRGGRARGAAAHRAGLAQAGRKLR